jgi:hypothetical protein
MTISASDAAAYLTLYMRRSRHEYQRFTAQPPSGSGYPSLEISPYLHSPEITCHLATNGAVIADQTREPPYQWEIAGGPALLVDYEQTRTSAQIPGLLKQSGLLGRNIGIYRIVAKHPLPDDVWSGTLPPPQETADAVVDSHTQIHVFKYNLDWHSLIEHLTFGAFGPVLSLPLPGRSSALWDPIIISHMGFATADRQHKRFFGYLEFLPHLDEAAWDPRSIWARVHVDIRRDFARAFAAAERGAGGELYIRGSQAEVPAFLPSSGIEFRDRLSKLESVINQFELLLRNRPNADERVFHSFLTKHPILLDVYCAHVTDRPRFKYPLGESPLGKEYVEPDLVIRRPGNSYLIVELEKPGKMLATKQGQPRAEVGQAAFQIGEFKAFVMNHYELLKQEFPGINMRHETMLVIGRSTSAGLDEGQDLRGYLDIVRQQYGADYVLLYDDVLDRAKQAYYNLASAAPEL